MELKPVRKGRYSGQGSWENQYEKLLATPQEAVAAIRNGDIISAAGAGSYPRGFDRALAAYVKEKGYRVDLISAYLLEQPEVLKEEYAEYINYMSFFFGQERNAYPNGNVSFFPIHLGQTGELLVARKPRVMAFGCTPPDENGWMSRSIWGSHVHRDAFESPHCEVVIAEVNKKLPYLHSDGEAHLMIHVSEVDYIVENDYDWPEVKTIPTKEEERKIAGYIAEMLEDGTCLQLGQGGLANSIGENLIQAGKKDFGLQTEVLTNCIAGLMKAGVLNNSRKSIYKGRSVASAVVGDKELWDFCHNNPDICMKEINWVNNPWRLSQNDNVVSINNALEIDLVGQVASEAIGKRQFTGTGGQMEWVYGSQMSKNGKSIIALQSTYFDKKEGKTKTRIRPELPTGSIVTTPRTMVEYVVTEYGVANLKFKSARERAKALISIAHPDFREELTYFAREYW